MERGKLPEISPPAWPQTATARLTNHPLSNREFLEVPIWQFMRDNWLSNRIFKTYDDIVALCCETWNKLIDQPWKIMSIGRRKWAHGF